MKESSLQSKIIKHLESKGAWTCKVITANKAGVPDILACLDGQFYAFEVKIPKGRVSQLQKYQISKIRDAGGTTSIARSISDVERVLDHD